MGKTSIAPEQNGVEVVADNKSTVFIEEVVNERLPIVGAQGKQTGRVITAEVPKGVDIDTILSHIGEYSRYQVALTLLLSVFMIGTVPHNMSVVFYTLEPGWMCTESGFKDGECRLNGTFDDGNEVFKERCHMNRSSWTFLTKNGFSIVTEFELICGKSWLVILIKLVGLLGGVFGALTTGIISDKFGRKWTMLVSYIILEISVFLQSFSPNSEFFACCSFVAGFCLPGVISQIFILLVELVSTKRRALASTITWIPFSLALALLSLQAYLVRDWRILARIISAPYLVILLVWKILPESVRWLQVRQKTNAAEDILRSIAKINRKPYPDVKLLALRQDEKEPGMKDLFCNVKWIYTMSLHGFIWCVYSIIFYGVSLSAAHLSGNIYINLAVLSVVEFPSVFCMIYLSGRFGLKKTVMLGNYVTVITLAVVSGISEDVPSSSASGIARVTFGILSMFFISIAFSSVYLLSTETFPTVLRSRGLHTLVILFIVGGTIAPWLTHGISLIHKRLPLPLITVLCLLAGLASLRLIETKDCRTHDTLRERRPSVLRINNLIDNVRDSHSIGSRTGSEVRLSIISRGDNVTLK